jgi:hypothetical protein
MDADNARSSRPLRTSQTRTARSVAPYSRPPAASNVSQTAPSAHNVCRSRPVSALTAAAVCSPVATTSPRAVADGKHLARWRTTSRTAVPASRMLARDLRHRRRRSSPRARRQRARFRRPPRRDDASTRGGARRKTCSVSRSTVPSYCASSAPTRSPADAQLGSTSRLVAEAAATGPLSARRRARGAQDRANAASGRPPRRARRNRPGSRAACVPPARCRIGAARAPRRKPCAGGGAGSVASAQASNWAGDLRSRYSDRGRRPPTRDGLDEASVEEEAWRRS